MLGSPLNGQVPILHAATRPEHFTDLGASGERIITSPSFTRLGIMKKNFGLYDAGLSSSGFPLNRFERPFMQQAWCGPTEEGKQAAGEAALRYYHSVKSLIPGEKEGAVASAVDETLAYYAKVRKGIDLLTVEKTLTFGGNFGSAQHLIDTIRVLRDEMGVDHYIGWFRIPTLDRKSALKSMEAFARDVIPALKKETSARAA